jgi:hypothetical protein
VLPLHYTPVKRGGWNRTNSTRSECEVTLSYRYTAQRSKVDLNDYLPTLLRVGALPVELFDLMVTGTSDEDFLVLYLS